ncbi:MAG: rRNA maturation RNase YbeY [Dehalococcoidales bacterium]|jgi:probable rRNA maturation factor|nr:rRNA maturation RNase YbeY [Dehalococcoidales bacterium]MDP7415598.1 rRNA maturation RNase YbeY [Dehalococcoidales bacterium]
MEINVLIDGDFTECPEESWLKNAIEQVLQTQDIDSNVELGLVITSQEKVWELNRSYRRENKPTDVLAFYMTPDAEGIGLSDFVIPPDDVRHLGEVIISYPQAVIQAQAHRYSVKKEITLLIIHGVLHLLGYNHEASGPERQMRAREKEILGQVVAPDGGLAS